MRLIPTVLASALALAVPAPPASAAPGVFTGTMHVDCFGCGISHATASLSFIPGGGVNGDLVVNAPPGLLCGLQWQFAGRLTGGRNADVTTAVVAGAMVITAIGDFSIGSGVALVTSPVGIPCGGPADIVLIGVVD